MYRTAVVSMLVGLCAVPAAGLSPAAKCESAKLKEAAKYGFCRLKAEAKSVKTGDPADYTKCADRYGLKWPLIEIKANGACPSDGDEAALQSFIAQHADDVAAALSGGSVPNCPADLNSCTVSLAACEAEPDGLLLRTGQATCHDADGNVIACAGTGQDGDVQAGLAHSYANNGDGTVTDTQTGLMWEVQSDDGSIHDRDNLYTWSDAFARVTQLNVLAFAGYTDWRLPNRNELLSLQNLGASEPSVFPAFNSGCAPGCTITTCSCVSPESYWSSTSFTGFPSIAWLVGFRFSSTAADSKTLPYPVRAVRDL